MGRQIENNHEGLKSFLWKMNFRVLNNAGNYSNSLYVFFFLAPRKQIDPGLVFYQADASQGQGVEMTAHECAPDLSRKRK